MKIVFFGDSITDAGKIHNPKFSLGSGFVEMIDTNLGVNYLQNIEILNQGIGGNKTTDLLERIQRDVIEEHPDIVVLMIGINDVWHPYDEGKVADLNNIISNLNKIIEIIQSHNIRLIALTPFLFPIDEHFKNLEKYVKELHCEMLKTLEKKCIETIDTYQILTKYADINGNYSISHDSVHPTILGHAIIAQSIKDYLFE